MLKCARCGRDSDDIQEITPDLITTELIESIDHGEQDLSGQGSVKVCAECMDELKGD